MVCKGSQRLKISCNFREPCESGGIPRVLPTSRNLRAMKHVRDRPGIAEWRDASFDNYRDVIEILGGWHNASDDQLLRRVLNIRSRTEPLLIRAGMIADGDRMQ
jgi:hypothetical protein